jgi:hypothetical protein
MIDAVCCTLYIWFVSDSEENKNCKMNCHYPAYISACKTAVRLQQDIFFCTDFCKTYFILAILNENID